MIEMSEKEPGSLEKQGVIEVSEELQLLKSSSSDTARVARGWSEQGILSGAT